MKLNYSKLIELNPTVYTKFTNSLGQEIELVEHPLRGDEYPVIAVFHNEKLAFATDFYETGDIDEVGGEYEVLLVEGELKSGFEIN
jgi:hypothetical protein